MAVEPKITIPRILADLNLAVWYGISIRIPYSLDQTPLSISRRTSGIFERNSGRSRIVAAPRLLFENTSTWTCLVTRFRWQVHDKQSRTSSNLLLHQPRGQNLLDQRYQSTVSLRIASLAATGINKRRSRINAAQTRAVK